MAGLCALLTFGLEAAVGVHHLDLVPGRKHVILGRDAELLGSLGEGVLSRRLVRLLRRGVVCGEKLFSVGITERRIVHVSQLTDRVRGQIGNTGSGTEPVSLDEIDHRIVSELTRGSRMSVTQVAENVHISRAHAYTRIGRLTSEGVLSRFTALVDPIKAGLRSSAYVTLKLRQDAWRELRDQLGAIPEVHHVALVGGDFDMILLVRAVDNIDLRRVIFDQLQTMQGYLIRRRFSCSRP